MRHDGVVIDGIGAVTGELVSVDEAIADGRYSVGEAERGGQVSVPVAMGLTGPELAVRAGRQAVRGGDGAFGLHLHATIHDPGVDFWSPSAFVAERVGVEPGMSMSVNAMSNSVLAGIELAAGVLSGGGAGSVLITAGDTFAAPRFDPWRADPGIAYGDGACAVTLGRWGRRVPVAEVVVTASYADMGLEGLHRGDTAWYCGRTCRPPVRLGPRKAQWLAAHGGSAEVDRRNAVGVTTVAKQALYDAGLEMGEVRWVLCPHYGVGLLHRHCLAPLGITAERTTAFLGRRLGHLGASDQIVDFHHLINHDRLADGDHLLLLGIGVGMTWTAVVLRRHQRPV